jgi:hypothetical protein
MGLVEQTKIIPGALEFKKEGSQNVCQTESPHLFLYLNTPHHILVHIVLTKLGQCVSKIFAVFFSHSSNIAKDV